MRLVVGENKTCYFCMELTQLSFTQKNLINCVNFQDTLVKKNNQPHHISCSFGIKKNDKP